MLPADFTQYTSQLMGAELWDRYLAAFSQPVPTSIRLNPFKPLGPDGLASHFPDATPIPWCPDGYWLAERPLFTADPLFHAGCYYVQEAGSMFLSAVMRQYVRRPVMMLDLCAAPGGKSTLARAELPKGSLLFANEPDRRRANILAENLQKQGHPDVVVTNNLPAAYRREGIMFDVIMTDVPCSGEGLFRRDHSAISEWSISNVMRCAQLQRDIVSEIWDSLRPGGLLIYSTCTFNTHEDEENVQYICDTLGADVLSVDVHPSWHITGSLLAGFDRPVYRFIPGTSQSEGLFVCVLRKRGRPSAPAAHPSLALDADDSADALGSAGSVDALDALDAADVDTAVPAADQPCAAKARLLRKTRLHVMYDGTPRDTVKGRDSIPSHQEALSISRDAARFPLVELTLEQAQRYLRREALVLPSDTPRGYVVVTYHGHPLGFVKNIGTRANNLYPKEWAVNMHL